MLQHNIYYHIFFTKVTKHIINSGNFGLQRSKKLLTIGTPNLYVGGLLSVACIPNLNPELPVVDGFGSIKEGKNI